MDDRHSGNRLTGSYISVTGELATAELATGNLS